MPSFGTTVNVTFKTAANTGLIKHLYLDNRQLNFFERVSIESNSGKKIELKSVGEMKYVGEGKFYQEFSVENQIIKRIFSFSSSFTDNWGSRFSISIKLPEQREFNIEWNLILKNPDYVFGDSTKLGKSAFPLILKEGELIFERSKVSHLRIEEIDGVNIALPLILKQKHDVHKYSFKKEEGLSITYGRRFDSNYSEILIEGFLSITRKDEPTPDNSLILVDSNDWKSVIRSCAYPLEIKKLDHIFKSNPLFIRDNNFPMIFTDQDSEESINEFKKLGQALKILQTRSISKTNKYCNHNLFRNKPFENPSFRWNSASSKFRFIMLLPDNPIISIPLSIIIRDLNILPLFKEDFNNTSLDIYLNCCHEKKIIILNSNIEENHKEILESYNVKVYECLLGNNEKTSIRLFKAYSILRMLDKIQWFELLINRYNSSNNKNTTLNILYKLVLNKIKNLPESIHELRTIQSGTLLLVKLLRTDFLQDFEDWHKLIIGIEGIKFFSSLKIRENKSISKLRRASLVSQNINENQIVSLIQYSLAFDTPSIIVDEDKHFNQKPKIVQDLIYHLEADNSLEQISEKLTVYLGNCPSLRFLQTWSEFEYNIFYTNNIIKKLPINPLVDKHNSVENHLYSTKGAISIFLKSDIPIEFGFGKNSISSFTFGRFFIGNSKVFRHQILSSFNQPRRSSEAKLKFSIITIEENKKLLEYNEKIREVLRCYGDTIEAKGDLTKNQLNEGFKFADLVLLFTHGKKDRIYYNISNNVQTLKSSELDEFGLVRAFLLMNSCETGLDYSGKNEGINASLSTLGFPLIVAPIHKVSFRAAALISMSIAKKLLYRIPLSQIIAFGKREAIKLKQFEQTSYLVFGSPYTRFHNPLLMDKREIKQCIEKSNV